MIAAVLLAAGAARRMGQLKQLLPYGDATLVTHAAQQALAAGLDPLVVVLGAEHQPVACALTELPVQIVKNARWEEGMGSSVAAGVSALAVDKRVTGAALLLADQPLVTAEHLKKLLLAYGSHHVQLAAALYEERPGVPAIFSSVLFEQLQQLSGHEGARHLLRDPSLNKTLVPIPEAAFDIDTPADYQRLSHLK